MTEPQSEPLAKTFDPAAIEAKWYAHWESSGAFRPSRPEAEPYTIVMPPPNVTGSLHIGHALDNTLQDILIRHARLQGKDALWVVGTDHAGIATQMVVERQMALHQQKRTDFTRDEFIAKVWEWKAESGGTITSQLRRLGASCDWENERFTMDEGFSKAVIKVFVDLYNQGLLYRDKRLVNWDPGLKTAISDLEVETREINGKFWHFKYPLADGSGFISVATTRPETMLADMAVAVNPSDARYTALIGKMVKLPITGRLIPIVADDHADPELGSGAVKITPGHDFNDFEVGKRAGFKAAEMLNMLDAEASLVQTADGLIPDDLLGLTVAEARKMVVERIDAAGLLEKVEDRVIQTPYGDRSGVVIEPWLTDQWYVDAKTLAGPAIEAVRNGAIKVVPQTWEKTYFNWMENIQPWCVSRQLWWGHRIPAWFGPDKLGTQREQSAFGDKIFVAADEAQMLVAARDHYGSNVDIQIVGSAVEAFTHNAGLGDFEDIAVLWRDNDVLDTWFSSALWPFGTLGWPGESPSPSAGEGGPEGRERGQAASAAQKNSSVEPNEVGSFGAPTRAAPSPSAPVGAPPSPASGEGLLARHYPNDVLISGFDILFFWDARMIMQGLHFMKEAPFKTLYLHGLVRAADGSKMSKSKGNTVDPLGLIDQYGADALRFTLTAMESQGRDIKLDEKRVEGYRNFATKLWNAARFCQANGIGASTSVAAPNAELAVNRWIIGEVVETLAKLDQAISDLRFDAMADTIYHFAWGTFCDWYLELIKPVLNKVEGPVLSNPPPTGEGDREAVEGREAIAERDGAAAPSGGFTAAPPSAAPPPPLSGEEFSAATETRAVAGWVFDQILVMLHPFMPFITEELWGSMGERESGLIHARWPEPRAEVDAEARAEIEWLIELVSAIRTARTELNVPPSARTNLIIDAYIYEDSEGNDRERDDRLWGRLRRNAPALARLVRIEHFAEMYGRKAIDCKSQKIVDKSEFLKNPGATIPIVVGDVTYLLPLEGAVDSTAERTRLTNAIAAITKERDSLAGRLGNPAFVEKAKPEAVEKARADHAEKAAEAERLQAALARLG
jgi:valyl-tRNA synthetase